MKLRKFISRLIVDFILILLVLPTSTTALYGVLREQMSEDWAAGITGCLGLLVFSVLLADVIRIIHRLEKDPYPPLLEVVGLPQGSYQQIIPTNVYVSALKCVATERHQFFAEQPVHSIKERVGILYEQVKNIMTTLHKIKRLRDDSGVIVTYDAVGDLNTLNVLRYLQLSCTNLLPLRMSTASFYISSADKPVYNWIVTANNLELSDAYERFKIPYSAYFGFGEHAPSDMFLWLRRMLPNPQQFITLDPFMVMPGVYRNGEDDKKCLNLSAYPQTAWQETAAYALALASHAAQWGTPRTHIIDLLDIYTSRQNFIVADKVLTSEQIYDWARAELFLNHDAEYTSNPPAVPSFVCSIVSGELVESHV